MVGALGLLSGCFARIDRNIAGLEPFALVHGSVTETAADSPVVLALFERRGDRLELAEVEQLDAPYHFALATALDYEALFVAFEDLDRSRSWQPGERLAIAEHRGGPLALELRDDLEPPPELVRLRRSLAREGGSSPEARGGARGVERWPVEIGKPVTLDDPIFTVGRGAEGMWLPLEHLERWGVGIYSIGPYEPSKPPVLLIYGVAGEPAQWRDLIASLRDDHQVLVFDWPTGLPLEQAAVALAELTAALHQRWGFDRMHVVTHSMGGLVARRAMQLAWAAEPGLGWFGTFVSVSTPWNGHEMMDDAIRDFPVSVPSWHDMQRDSEFIRMLFAGPLPPGVEHVLLFSFRGGRQFEGNNSDGGVSIASQLDPRAQREAVHVQGLDLSHMQVLSHAEGIAAIRAALGRGEPASHPTLLELELESVVGR